MTRTLRSFALFTLATAVLSSGSAEAQGVLSGQGFGYPPGQVSVRALGTGGSLGSFDPQSGLNPAALGLWGRPGIYAEYAPEFRRVTFAGARDRTTVSRFPTAGAALRLGTAGMLGVNVTTLLDRTWATQFADTQILGDDTLAYIARSRSEGAMNDVRLGAAWSFSPRFQAGIGVHAITGQNRRFLGIEPVNCPDCDSLAAPSRVSYGGTALSAGILWQPLRQVAIAAAGRRGNRLTAYVEDTVVSRATAPDQASLAVRFDGITGVALAASWRWDGWSRMDGLGSDSVHVSDSHDLGVGAEVQGPRVGSAVVPLRVGFRWRTLPFGLGGEPIRERAFGAGLGVPFAQNRATFDLSLQTARRRASGDSAAREIGWTVGLGLFIRP
jgi:hypothetical protein